jgi:hypothetical protein
VESTQRRPVSHMRPSFQMRATAMPTLMSARTHRSRLALQPIVARRRVIMAAATTTEGANEYVSMSLTVSDDAPPSDECDPRPADEVGGGRSRLGATDIQSLFSSPSVGGLDAFEHPSERVTATGLMERWTRGFGVHQCPR